MIIENIIVTTKTININFTKSIVQTANIFEGLRKYLIR
jgi:hypothetical protein